MILNAMFSIFAISGGTIHPALKHRVFLYTSAPIYKFSDSWQDLSAA